MLSVKSVVRGDYCGDSGFKRAGQGPRGFDQFARRVGTTRAGAAAPGYARRGQIPLENYHTRQDRPSLWIVHY